MQIKTRDRGPERKAFNGMRQRCQCPTNKNYSRYGGRGIRVCDRWMEKNKGFPNFLADMGRKPSLKHMLDRIDNDGPYSPDNCRWVLMKDQVRNRSVTLKDDDGTPIAAIAEKHGLKYMTVYARYRNGARGNALIGGN